MNTRKRQKPIKLENFEGEIDNWTSRGDRCQSVSISHITHPCPVRFGKYALKLTYDFTNTIGTSGAYACLKEGIIISDEPSAIGMWVFGNGSGHMIRAQMRDRNQHAFQINFVENIDWQGWKYIEASIPEGKTPPLTLEIPIRVIEISNDNKDAGYIYIDHIQAVYNENDQDVTNPEIIGECPADGELVRESECRIRARIVDEDSGVHSPSIKLYLNGTKVKIQFNEKTGEIISKHQMLLNGIHNLRLIAQDCAGNESEKWWQFEVDANMPGVRAHAEPAAFIGELVEVKLEVNKLHIFDTLKLEFVFNDQEIEMVHTQVLLHECIPQQAIIANKMKEEGHIHLELKDLHKISAAQNMNQLGKIIFRLRNNVSQPVKVIFQNCLATLKGSSKRYSWHMNPLSITAKAHYEICIDRTTIGFESNMTILDERKAPVGGVSISIDEIEIGTTNEDGVLTTRKLGQKQGNRMIQARKGNNYSFLTKVKVLNQFGSHKPEMINIMFGNDLSCMVITWITSPQVTNTYIEYISKKDYGEKGFNHAAVKRINGISKEYAFEDGEVQVHRVHVANLEEKACYAFRVGDGTNERWSKVGEFCTPKKQYEPFHFLLFGDTQAPPIQTNEGYGLFKKIFTRAKKEYRDASFFVHVGDMVDDGNLFTHWEAFFQAINTPDLALSMPIVPTVGNHENIGTGLITFATIFNVPNNGPSNLRGTVYTFDYGDARFAILNTETAKDGLMEQANWLKTIMRETDKKWKIIIQHRSPYYSNPDGGSENVQEVFPEIFDELKIDLVISGHDHSYIRTHPLKNSEINCNGTTYLIAGSTGNKFYAAAPQSYMKVYFDEKTQVYTKISISNNRLQVTVKKVDGSMIDKFTCEK